MRKALIVGIDHYEHIQSLHGCVNDANDVKAALERHADGTVNFRNPKVMRGTSSANAVGKQELKEAVRELFGDQSEIALFYFAGHGYIKDTGGFLCTSDCKTGDDGLPLSDVMTIASKSPATNKVIILDSCHSGIAGSKPNMREFAEIVSGMTILTASTEDQYAMEGANGKPGGVFTGLMVDALTGAAANLVGDVTAGQCLCSHRPVVGTLGWPTASVQDKRAILCVAEDGGSANPSGRPAVAFNAISLRGL